MKDGKRITTYDWVRLIGTILVVLGHSAYLTVYTIYGGINYELPENTNVIYYSRVFEWIHNVPNWIYKFHMPLFIALSGAVLALRSIESFDVVVKNKAKRLLVPYFISGWLFMMPIKAMTGYYDRESLLLAMKGFLRGEDSGHLWFLPALFWCTIIFVLLKKLLERVDLYNPYIMLLLCGIVQLFLAEKAPIEVLGLGLGMKYELYFAMGYVFELERDHHDRWNRRKLLFSFAMVCALEIADIKYDLLTPLFEVVVACFGVYIVARICEELFERFTFTKIWKVLIRNLFAIYLFHDPLEYIIIKIFIDNNMLVTVGGCFLYTILRTVGVFGVSVIIGEIVSCVKNKVSLILR